MPPTNPPPRPRAAGGKLLAIFSDNPFFSTYLHRPFLDHQTFGASVVVDNRHHSHRIAVGVDILVDILEADSPVDSLAEDIPHKPVAGGIDFHRIRLAVAGIDENLSFRLPCQATFLGNLQIFSAPSEEDLDNLGIAGALRYSGSPAVHFCLSLLSHLLRLVIERRARRQTRCWKDLTWYRTGST